MFLNFPVSSCLVIVKLEFSLLHKLQISRRGRQTKNEVRRLGDRFHTDIIFSSTSGPARCKSGLKSLFARLYTMPTKADIPKSYADLLRKVGAPLGVAHGLCSLERKIPTTCMPSILQIPSND